MSEQHLIELCALDELPEGTSRGFDHEDGSVFIVRQSGRVYGYINSCPHTGAPLEWLPDQFLSLDRNYIQCSLHGARFEIGTGLCIQGPCVDAYLQRANIEVTNGHIVWITGDAT